ncbi:MAG: hypothetical protein DWQ10_03440 [Calditrichaeota bacterium]|nr:MAG: hypothetical protein DWQ10_03440 [Calditrichota bacterium]
MFAREHSPFSNISRLLIVMMFGCLFLSSLLSGQDIKSHEIGLLWDTMYATGSIPGYAPVDDRLTYPGGDFWLQTGKNLAGRGTWIGVKDWTDQFGVFHPVYVSEGGYANDEANGFTFPISNKKQVRDRLPNVIVNGTADVRILDKRESSTRAFSPTADERIETKWATNTGISVRRRSYAFANYNHNSYIVLEYQFTNDGNVDGNTSDKELSGQNLKDVYFGFQYYMIPGGDRGHPQVDEHDDWAEYYGNQPGDSLRGLLFLYDGDSKVKTYDDIGDPDQFTGEFLSPQYPGIGVLHADTDYDNQIDDPNQPSTIEIKPQVRFKSYTKGSTEGEMYEELSSGNLSQGTVGVSPNPYDSDVRQPIALLSFGPYDLPPGESINIVLYEAVGAISKKQAIQAGREWKDGTLSFDGKTGDEAKNALIATGRDSLFMHASRAEFAWQIELKNIPTPPPSPNLTLTSGPGRIELSWVTGDDPENPHPGDDDFAGYRVYRSDRPNDNLYTMIWECGGNSGVELTNEYWDFNVERGKNYYYYVTSYDDGSDNTTGLFPGQSLESSPFYNRNSELGATAAVPPATNMDSVLVVPNPYHLQGLAYGGTFQEDYLETLRPEDQLSFVGLPAKAIIRIFTVNGNLVETIQHPNPQNPNSIPGSADETWYQISSSYQTIKSGVYFFYVEGWDRDGKPLGSTSGKFVIIR